MWQVISSLFLPVGLLVGAFFLAPMTVRVADSDLILLQLLPLVIVVPLIILTLRFNRSRLFFSALAIVLVYVVLIWGSPPQTNDSGRLVVQLLSLLAPLNLLIFSELKERGVFTGWGSTRFMLLLVPAIIGWVLIQYQPVWSGSILGYRFMQNDLTRWTPLSQTAQVVVAVVFFIMNGRLFSRPGAQRGALFGSLIGLLIVLHYPHNIYIVSIFTAAILLMYAAALVQDSWSMAYIDHLTGLPGRRALNEKLLTLSGNYSVAMLDIDHFKKFNDTYGHDVGDEVLRMVAQRIGKVASGGKAYRYGGEEFCIVFSGKQTEEVTESLEEVREGIAATGFQPQRKERRQPVAGKSAAELKEVKVTISIGVAEHSETHAESAEVIIAADKALYNAKKKGRNRVCEG